MRLFLACGQFFFDSMNYMSIKQCVALGLLVGLFLSAGCATDVASRYYATETYPPKDVKEVELLYKKPTRDFIVIADFQSRGESPESMRSRAAKIGADAIIVSIIGSFYDKGDEWAGQDTAPGIDNRITGTVIRYK